MTWYVLTRQTSEAGNSELKTATVMLNSDAVQFFQQTPTATKVYLRSGALDAIDVLESIEEILEQSEAVEGSHGSADGVGAVSPADGRMGQEGDAGQVLVLPAPEGSD